MSEERERVLKLLEDGKINADQAARLIQALGSQEPPAPPEPPLLGHRRHTRFHFRELDRIPDIVANAVSSAVRTGVWPQEGETKTEFRGKNSLFLKSVSGNVDLAGWDEDRISLEGMGGMVRVREREDQVMVRSISGDITGKMPRESRIELVSVSGDVGVSGIKGKFGLKSVSGDIDIEDFQGDVRVDIVSGDIRMTRVSGTITIESKSGDVEIEPVSEFGGEVVSKSGDIDLRLRPDANVELEMECEEEGDITLDVGLDQEVLEQGERKLKVRLGKGGQVMKLRTRKADIKVREAKEE